MLRIRPKSPTSAPKLMITQFSGTEGGWQGFCGYVNLRKKWSSGKLSKFHVKNMIFINEIVQRRVRKQKNRLRRANSKKTPIIIHYLSVSIRENNRVFYPPQGGGVLFKMTHSHLSNSIRENREIRETLSNLCILSSLSNLSISIWENREIRETL